MREAYTLMYQIVLPVLGIALLLCLVRAIRGPRIADRVIAINMMGTICMISICILAFLMGEGYLTDVALIYAMLSFLAVVLLTKIYIGVYLGRNKQKEADDHDRA